MYEVVSYMLLFSNLVGGLTPAMTMMKIVMINHRWRFDTVLIVQTHVRGGELYAGVQQPDRGSGLGSVQNH